MYNLSATLHPAGDNCGLASSFISVQTDQQVVWSVQWRICVVNKLSIGIARYKDKGCLIQYQYQ